MRISDKVRLVGSGRMGFEAGHPLDCNVFLDGGSGLGPTLGKPRWLFKLEPVKLQTWQGVDWAARYK